MKLVAVGDILITPEMMEAAIADFPRYDISKVLYFGTHDRMELRSYIKNIEMHGFNCVPLDDAIYSELEDADVLMVHMCPVPAKVFDVAKNLKIVASNRGGAENLDIETATKHGIPVICNPAHNANGVAEMTIGMMIAETRNIGRCHESMHARKEWLEKFPNSGNIHELKGRTVGLIGCGTIGRLVVDMLKAFHTRILVFDPYARKEDIEAMGAELVDMETLLKSSDIVSMHARVSPDTIGLMGAEQFAMMKPTAYFINTARPLLVNTKAMYEALKDRRIMGAALDVYDVEPIEPDNPLLTLDNVTFCCHKGGDTTECFSDSPAMVLGEIERFFDGKTPKFLKNPEVLRK